MTCWIVSPVLGLSYGNLIQIVDQLVNSPVVEVQTSPITNFQSFESAWQFYRLSNLAVKFQQTLSLMPSVQEFRTTPRSCKFCNFPDYPIQPQVIVCVKLPQFATRAYKSSKYISLFLKATSAQHSKCKLLRFVLSSEADFMSVLNCEVNVIQSVWKFLLETSRACRGD